MTLGLARVCSDPWNRIPVVKTDSAVVKTGIRVVKRDFRVVEKVIYMVKSRIPVIFDAYGSGENFRACCCKGQATLKIVLSL